MNDLKKDVAAMMAQVTDAYHQLGALAAQTDPEKIQRTLERVSSQTERAALAVRKLCEKHSPGVGGYGNRPVLPQMEAAGFVETLGYGWLHIQLNTLLPHCRYQTSDWLSDICTNFLRSLDATKLSITGHMYFVPRTYMDKVDIFEDFITLLSGLNKKKTPLAVNSLYIIDDEKQRGKMTEEFYLAVKKEIAAYQERCDYLIHSGSHSPSVMDRWVLKVKGLEEKKKHYEQVLRRELDGLDDEFTTLKFLAQELQIRANNIRLQKAA